MMYLRNVVWVKEDDLDEHSQHPKLGHKLYRYPNNKLRTHNGTSDDYFGVVIYCSKEHNGKKCWIVLDQAGDLKWFDTGGKVYTALSTEQLDDYL